jgi:hypothetical protein
MHGSHYRMGGVGVTIRIDLRKLADWRIGSIGANLENEYMEQPVVNQELTTTDPLTHSSPTFSPTHRSPSPSTISPTLPLSISLISTRPLPTSSIRRKSALWRLVFSVIYAMG